MVHIFVLLLSLVFWTPAFDIFSVTLVFRDLFFHTVEEGSYLCLNTSGVFVDCMHENVTSIASLLRQILLKFRVMRAEAGLIGGKVIRSLETVTGCACSGVTGWHQRHGNINIPIKVPRSALKAAQFDLLAYSFMDFSTSTVP